MIKRFVKLFTNFYINILIILMAMVIVSCSYYLGKLEIMDIAPIIIGVAIIFLCFFTIKNKKISNRWKLSIILFLGFILRGLWLLNINSSPTSDFRVIYEVAGSLLEGDVGAFWGNGYIARFPHLTIMSLLIYLILCGYGVMCLITESQARYSLIIAWAFIILAIEGIRFLLRKSNREDTFEKI